MHLKRFQVSGISLAGRLACTGSIQWHPVWCAGAAVLRNRLALLWLVDGANVH